MKRNKGSRRLASGLTTGIVMGVGGMSTLAAAQTPPGFTAVAGLVAPANDGQAFIIQTASGPVTVPASAYVVQNGVVLVNASTLTAIQAAGGLVGGLGMPTAIASSTLAAVGGVGFLILNAPEPETPGSISNGTRTVDLGIGFTVDETTGDGLFQPESSFTIIGSSGDDTIGAIDVHDNTVGAKIGAGAGNKVSIDLTAGGSNNLVFGTDSGGGAGNVEILAGVGDDTIEFGGGAAVIGGTVEIDLSAGGNNSVTFGRIAGYNGSIEIVGGSGDDALAFGESAASFSGTIGIDFSAGGTNSVTFGNNAGSAGSIKITGGDGEDVYTFIRNANNIEITDFGVGPVTDTIWWITSSTTEPTTLLDSGNLELSGIDFGITLIGVNSVDDINIARNEAGTAFSITG